jgi:hypothetical protein
MCFSLCNGYNSLGAFSQPFNGGEIQQFSIKEIRDAVLNANGGGKSRGVIPLKAMMMNKTTTSPSVPIDFEKVQVAEWSKENDSGKKAI